MKSHQISLQYSLRRYESFEVSADNLSPPPLVRLKLTSCHLIFTLRCLQSREKENIRFYDKLLHSIYYKFVITISIIVDVERIKLHENCAT